jgi:hypothetical protein
MSAQTALKIEPYALKAKPKEEPKAETQGRTQGRTQRDCVKPIIQAKDGKVVNRDGNRVNV